MTSQELLNSWNKAKGVFNNQAGPFFTLHRICAAGAEGITIAELVSVSAVPARTTLDRWRAAGLITRTRGRSANNRLTITWHATAKAYQLLRVEAPSVNGTLNTEHEQTSHS